jgi:hypothetical protein
MFVGEYTRAPRSFKDAGAQAFWWISDIAIADVPMLAACGARVGQCDATNVLGANCYQQQGPPYRS